MLDKIMTVIFLLMGLYFICNGMTKKGGFYNNPNIAGDKQEVFKKDMSLFLLIGGPVLSAGAVLELIGVYPLIYAACYGAVIIFAVILMFRMRAYIKRG